MPDNRNTIDYINEEVTKDPTNQNWIKFVMYPFFLIGFIATGVSAYIEYNFFNEVFQNFAVASFFIVIAFEGAKIGVIILYEYAKSHIVSFLNGSLSKVTWLLRISLIIFSVICSFSKISQYMDNPNFDKIFGDEKKRITNEYVKITEDESQILQARENTFKADMDNESNVYVKGHWNGPRYKEKQKLYDKAVENREIRIKELKAERDNLITEAEKQIRENPKSKNQILLGIYSTFQRLGILFKTVQNKSLIIF